MISVLIKHGNNSLVTEFPVEAMRLYNQLGSIGINTQADKIPALGDGDISVKLFPSELLMAKKAVGQSLIKRLTAADTLYDLNVACYWLKEACAKNHEAFAEFILKTSPSSLAELRDLAKDFHQRPSTQPVISHDYDEEQDMDDELEP
ncbi:hypothetical protein [Dehalobacterium formicoaceticum]|uniref:hypothetical protein n=1 Tax=Dehalobacterium formicoaceticum TaxID=51515 RepID=UPI0031F66864